MVAVEAASRLKRFRAVRERRVERETRNSWSRWCGRAFGGLPGPRREEVVLLVRPEKRHQHPETLHLERGPEQIEARVAIATSFADDVDVFWIAVKAHQLTAALQEVAPVAPGSSIVPLLNGIEHVPLLRSMFEFQRVVPATILVSAERVAPGHIIQRSPFVRLAISIVGERKLLDVAARLQYAGFVVEFPRHEKTMLWRKLAFLAPLALTGAASGKDKEGIFADASWRDRLDCAVREVSSVAIADGAIVEEGEVVAAISVLPAGMRSSLQKDVACGVPTELDGIGGAILRAAERLGVDVPAIRELVADVQQITKTAGTKELH